MLLFILFRHFQKHKLLHFNTSHVTVYLSDCCCTTQRNIFQYISCYCLSYKCFFGNVWYIISIHLMLLFIGFTQPVIIDKNKFQYISCYCLSNCLASFRLLLLHFNTSHVTVYHIEQSDHLHHTAHFNTSHVTVYRLLQKQRL